MIRAFKKACRIITDPFKDRHRRRRLKALETERLDRICNPSKYRGK
jgi:hypothetical protein